MQHNNRESLERCFSSAPNSHPFSRWLLSPTIYSSSHSTQNWSDDNSRSASAINSKSLKFKRCYRLACRIIFNETTTIHLTDWESPRTALHFHWCPLNDWASFAFECILYGSPSLSGIAHCSSRILLHDVVLLHRLIRWCRWTFDDKEANKLSNNPLPLHFDNLFAIIFHSRT